ncbi:ATP-binding protein [Planctomycetota bacterium]
MHPEHLLACTEGKTREFKRDSSSPAGVLRTLVAFANTSGGVLVIGVDDRTRNVRGVASPLDVEERLANIVSDGIRPLLSPEISIVPWRQTHLVVVEVFPSSLRPHHVRKEGSERGIYVRVGSSNRRADSTSVAEMRRRTRNESFDEQPMPELSSEAIDFRAASELFADVKRLKRSDLLTLRLTAKHQGRTVPTVAGILLFGADREAHFPDAWIQAGRFGGRDRTKILDSTSLHSLPLCAIGECLDFIRKHVFVEVRIEGLRRKDAWPVPLPAIREALTNAVVHADYSQSGAPIRVSIFDDRIEFENPGLLPFGLTVEDLRHGISRLRNRAVGRVFHELGQIEQWGSGIQRMTSACRDAGLPEPQLEEIGTHFRVTLSSERKQAPVLDEIDQAILDMLADGQGRSTSEISKPIGRSTRATRTRLLSLIGRGMIREVGTGPRDPKRKYFAVR